MAAGTVGGDRPVVVLDGLLERAGGAVALLNDDLVAPRSYPNSRVGPKRGPATTWSATGRKRGATPSATTVREVAAEYGDPDELLRKDWISQGISIDGDYETYASDPVVHLGNDLRE